MDYHRNLLEMHRRDARRYPFLLQSVAHGTKQARYDILFAFPQASIRLANNGLYGNGLECGDSTDFLAALDRAWQANNAPQADVESPFRGGWFVYLGYELIAQIEPRLAHIPVASDLPVACAVRVPAAIVKDHERQSVDIVVEPGFEHLRGQIESDWARAQGAHGARAVPIVESISEEDPQRHLDAVQRIKDYIVAGDVFQVNLSRSGWCELRNELSDADLYTRLCDANPAPFAALAVFDEGTIISSSPERLIRVREGRIETRPIAGTRPRGANPETDRTFIAELMAHPKERAEHIMLVDLERNDLGRVCVPGSVRVDELMTLESYAHVHHLVSNVSGNLRPGTTPGEVIRAVFPGGTITGCPKVRCMEIIAELEQRARGAYTGSLGYLNHDGSMDLNILIRTLVRRGRRVGWRAGGGVVADSIPERELEETRAKARGLLRALGYA